jgi:hypothetical protein
MSLGIWKQVASAVAGLSPEAVLRESEAPFTVALIGSAAEVSRMEDWLVPPSMSPAQQAQSRRLIYSMAVPLTDSERTFLPSVTVRLAGWSAVPPISNDLHSVCRDYLPFTPEDTASLAARIANAHSDLQLAMARAFPALREAVVGRIIQRTAKENAAFAILSALPNVVPAPIELPWAVGEFASDTVVITANQVRMALAIAAACDTPVGFGEQRGQMASILGSAFGLRALARELAGKIPAGGGVVAKGCIAFAGTYTLGLGLAHWNRSGRKLSWGEKRLAYKRALESGRDVVEDMARRALSSPSH